MRSKEFADSREALGLLADYRLDGVAQAFRAEFPFSYDDDQIALAETAGSPFVKIAVPYTDDFREFGFGPSNETNHDDKNILKEKLGGKDLFDMGYGHAEYEERFVKWLSEMGMARYIGVDMRGKNGFSFVEDKQGKLIPVHTVCSEFLNFLRSVPNNHGGNFLFCGVEEGRSRNSPYIEKLFSELYRVTRPGDVLIVTSSSLRSNIGKDVIRINGETGFKKVDVDSRKMFIYERI